MSATAVAPLRRRTLERTGMTPEQELELLIREQEADDTDRLYPPNDGWYVSLDAPAPSGEGGTVGEELIGYDPWDLVDAAIDLELDATQVAYSGPLINHLPPRRGTVLTDPRKVPHGTAGGYQNHKCKCHRCKAAWATYKRERRAAARAS